MPATNTTRRLHAEPAYENAHLVALDLLDRIRELLYSLSAHGNDHPPIRWEQVAGLVRATATWPRG